MNCKSINPANNVRCGLPEGHGGRHCNGTITGTWDDLPVVEVTITGTPNSEAPYLQVGDLRKAEQALCGPNIKPKRTHCDCVPVAKLVQSTADHSWTVIIACLECGKVAGYMHPKSALDLGGEDSAIGKAILAVFPDWKAEPSSKLIDVLKRDLK